MKTYLITEDQLKSIDSGLTLAECFLDMTQDGECWASDNQKHNKACRAFDAVFKQGKDKTQAIRQALNLLDTFISDNSANMMAEAWQDNAETLYKAKLAFEGVDHAL